MRYALAALALLAASPAAADALPHFAQDTPYTTVRKKLIAMGYKPHRSPDADRCYAGSFPCYPEQDSCASGSECNFQWQKNGHVIVVSTFGEPPTFTGIGNLVNEITR